MDQHNTAHIAGHAITREEVVQALTRELVDLDSRITPDGETRWTAVGQTRLGRILVIVWTVLEDEVYRPITAYPATKGVETVYRCLMQGN